jgi:hypothetical protein
VTKTDKTVGLLGLQLHISCVKALITAYTAGWCETMATARDMHMAAGVVCIVSMQARPAAASTAVPVVAPVVVLADMIKMKMQSALLRKAVAVTTSGVSMSIRWASWAPLGSGSL